METMDGKVALVTGGSSGIGRATARLFAKRGAAVAVADVNVAGAQETVDMINSDGGKAILIECDVADDAQVKAMVEKTVSTLGRLDYAHNNAGIDGPMSPIADYDNDAFDQVIAINLKGVYLGLKHQIPVMVEQGGGAIVNTASVAGLIGFPGLGPYVATKHAVNGLTKNAALENATSGVRVNSLCPGVIRTAMLDQIEAEDPAFVQQIIATTPMARYAEPEEMAEVVVWLCSDGASFVTGHMLVADGGLTAQ